jgi:zinc transport system substrate-binding protein
MKWTIKAFLIAVTLMCFASCGDKGERGADSKGAGRPVVYATNYPLAYFAESLGASVVDVKFPVPEDEDPAYWRPGPDAVLAMQNADLIVLNGASHEQWLETVSLLPSRMLVTTDPFRDELIPLEGKTTHSHGVEGEHEHAGTAFTTWLDPTLAASQAGAIANALVSRWPSHAAQFEEQLVRLNEELMSLDAAMRETVALNPKMPVLFSHPVYQYLVHRYDLNARSVHWEPDQTPSEDEWRRLEGILEGFPASWMIWEGKPLDEVRGRLDALGVGSVVFDPCANIPPEGDFLSTMQKNVEALRLVFGGDE